MRVFELHRDADISGVSGTGIVAQGVEFDDGSVALRWGGDWPTSVVFYDEGIEAVRQIHGHGGATRIVYLGYDQQPLARTPMPLGFTDRGFGVWATDLVGLNGVRIDVIDAPPTPDEAVQVRIKGDHIDQPSALACLDVRQATALRDALNLWLLWLGDGAAHGKTDRTS